MNYISIESSAVSAPVYDMLKYFDMFLTDLTEAEKLDGDERVSAFVNVAHKKYELMSESDAINLSKGKDTTSDNCPIYS